MSSILYLEKYIKYPPREEVAFNGGVSTFKEFTYIFNYT